MIMAIGLLLILQTLLYHLTTAAVYNYGETSEAILFPFNNNSLSGFRNITNKDFILGGLFPVYDCTGLGQHDLELLEAMLFAIDQINNDMNLLPNLIIGYDVRDTCNDETIGLDEALDYVLEYNRPGDFSTPFFLGIVGPANTSVTHPVATLLGLEIFQFPLVSYGSSDAALSNKDLYKNLLRTIPSDSLQANAMVDVISHFGWEYVNIIFSDDEYGISGSNAFTDGATQHNICIDVKIGIPSSDVSGTNKTVVKAVKALLNSKASVVVVFTDEYTVLALFEKLNETISKRKLLWIASDKWTNSSLVYDRFPETTRGMIGFQLHTEHIDEFANYYSQLTPTTNVRDAFFRDIIYYVIYCDIEGSGIDCPDDLTDVPNYSQANMITFVIDAVYVFAHALQNFLYKNCDIPLRWDRAKRQCVGMKHNLTI